MTPLDTKHAVRLQLVSTGTDALVAVARELFREYQRALNVDLCFQNFEQELLDLPGAYAPPAGRLYVGMVADQAACCVALRQHDATTGEMKRLYVRPAYRGRRLGLLLTRTVIDDAMHIGYQRLVLDTLPTMTEAQAMYARLGFRDTHAYTHNPIAGTRFMALSLPPNALP